MDRLFASYLAEELVSSKVTGAYDPEQQLWIGDSLPLAGNITGDGDGGGGSLTSSLTQNPTFGDRGFDTVPDGDTDFN